MIDLVATRANVDAQTKACARLLAAVISTAIKDAAEHPNSTEKSCEFNLRASADKAIRWLFEPNTPFVAYSRLIGMEAQAIRDALLSNRPLHQARAVQATFSDQDRRIIQVRYRWFLNGKQNPGRLAEMIEKYKGKEKEEEEDVQSN